MIIVACYNWQYMTEAENSIHFYSDKFIFIIKNTKQDSSLKALIFRKFI